MSTKQRIEKFKEAYPELENYEDELILKILNHDKSARREMHKNFMRRMFQEVLQPL